MIVAAHQPHYLPWLGYLDKVATADLFVVMDDLQYEAQNFQNRNRMKLNHGPQWLTVPLERGPQDERIMRQAHRQSRHRPRSTGSARPGTRCRSTTAGAVLEAATQPISRTLHAAVGSAARSAAAPLAAAPALVRDLHAGPARLVAGAARAEDRSDRSRSVSPSAPTSTCRAAAARAAISTSSSWRAPASASIWQQFVHPIYPQRYPSLGFKPKLARARSAVQLRARRRAHACARRCSRTRRRCEVAS